MRVGRYERLDATSLKPPVRMDNGFMRVEGRIARVGIQVYHKADGTESRELRLPEEVFHPDSLASFAQLPVTNCHPPGMLTAKNAKKYSVGAVGENVRQDGDFVAAPLMLHDAEAIAAVEAGRSQLSNGYSCELDPTQDPELTARWGKYDAIMRNIRGNHVALVDIARAGPGASLRLDAYGELALECESVQVTDEMERNTMPHKFTMDGLLIEVADANAQAIIEKVVNAHKERADAAEEALSNAREAKMAEAARADGLAGELAAEKAKTKEVIDSMEERISKLDEVKEMFRPHLGSAKLPNNEIAIMRLFLDKQGIKTDGANDDFVRGAARGALASMPSAADAARAGLIPTAVVTDSDNSPEAARQRMLKRNAEMAK